jgi:multidrug efflux system membrane fusion protein
MPVGVAPVRKGDMLVTLKALGTVTPIATVTVRTQIAGQLIEVAFQEGQVIKAGDFLAQIDPRPYQVALEQAEAQLAKDQAALDNAERDLERYNTLVAQDSIARQKRDSQNALVAQYKGTIQSDEAQVNAQKLNLAYARIVSPVTGRIGLRLVDAGNYVQPTDTNGIAIITQLRPISVIFTLTEDGLRRVAERLHGRAKVPVTAYDRAGTTQIAEGALEAIDNQIDLITGTVKLRAIFNNEEGALFPNQFVNVRILVESLHDVNVVPSVAIQHGPGGDFVYLVRRDDTVAARTVRLGTGDGQRTMILSGLERGDYVVVDGADRLHEGTKVAIVASIDNTAEPGTEPPHAPGSGQGGGHRRGQGGGGGHGRREGGGQERGTPAKVE